jgi:hypothetical protein
MTPYQILLVGMVSLLAVSGFAFAEVLRLWLAPVAARIADRLHLFPDWDRRRPISPQLRLAWWIGGFTYACNLVNWLFMTFGGGGIETPTSGMDLTWAVLLYPLMCVVCWPLVLTVHHMFRGFGHR